MKNNYMDFLKYFTAIILTLTVINAYSDEYPRLDINTEGLTKIELESNDSLQLQANYIIAEGDTQPVKIKWHTVPGYLGKIDKNDILKTIHPGEGLLYARYGSLRDSIAIEVTGTKQGGGVDVDDSPKVKIVPGSVKIIPGDSVELVGFYVNEIGDKVDTTLTWSVSPGNLGGFPNPNISMFYANEEGSGIITATLGELADTIKLKVETEKIKTNNGKSGKQLTIVPGDTIVNAGLATLQYTATFKSNGNKQTDAEVTWNIDGDPVGTIDDTGLLTFTANETGLALITATKDNFSATVELLVVDPDADTQINTISIHRVLPDGNELPVKNLEEGESFKIGGLPFPLNILNGGMLHFPYGSIHEDIVIYMFIPEEYATVDNDSSEVTFDEGIITGVKFNVMPIDSSGIVEPYWFDRALNLSLTFKRGLLDSLGVDPSELDVFFANQDIFVTDGTGNVAIDTVKNKIYSQILHFSTIVVRQNEQNTNIEANNLNSKNSILVYPNPFNTSTKIRYTVPQKSDVKLMIYNINGQQIKSLVNEKMEKGSYNISWAGVDDSNLSVKPGVYFCRLLLNGESVQSKQIILSK